MRVNRPSPSSLLLTTPADVLREAIMEPVGATNTWVGIRISIAKCRLTGLTLPSVQVVHTGAVDFHQLEDHARVALMVARNGNWGSKLSRARTCEITRPSPCFDLYGMLRLNTEQRYYSNAREYFRNGAGTSFGSTGNSTWSRIQVDRQIPDKRADLPDDAGDQTS